MQILGIDPGKKLGLAIIESETKELIMAKTVKIKEEKEFLDAINEVIIENKIAIVSLEAGYVGFNRKGSLKLAEFRGIIKAVCFAHELDVIEFAPMEIKKFLGIPHKQRKSKSIVAINLIEKFDHLGDISELDDNAVDAIAIAFILSSKIIPKRKEIKLLEK